jgi:hypothetical protein
MLNLEKNFLEKRPLGRTKSIVFFVTKHHAMKAYKRSGGKGRVLNVGGEWSASWPVRRKGRYS